MVHKNIDEHGNDYQSYWVIVFIHLQLQLWLIDYHIDIIIGWLRPSKKADYYSYCSYCDKHLKANRRSLLDHAKSRVHLDSLLSVKGRKGRQTIHNIPLVDDMSDPLLANEPIKDEDDYDDTMAGIRNDYMDDDYDGSAFVTTNMEDYSDEAISEHEGKDGILVQDSENDDNDENGFQPPMPPLVQMGVGDDYNGQDTVSLTL